MESLRQGISHPSALPDGRYEARADETLYKERVELYLSGGGKEINARVEEIAGDKGVSMAQIALTWLLHKDWVDAPIVGATDVRHVEEAVEAVDVSLASSEIDYLEEPYRPLEITGHE